MPIINMPMLKEQANDAKDEKADAGGIRQAAGDATTQTVSGEETGAAAGSAAPHKTE